MKKYKVTYISIWVAPQVFFAIGEDEKNQLVFDGKNQQYKVEIEEMQEGTLHINN